MKRKSFMKGKRFVTYVKKNFVLMKMEKNKVRNHCHYTAKFGGVAHSIFNFRCKVPKEIPIVAHNVAYDHHFIINQLGKQFRGQFKCIGENDEKCITFSAPIKRNMIMVKQLHTGQSLLIALDLCQPHYQNLLITYLKGFIKISVKFVNLNLVLLLRKGLYPYEYMES